MKRCRVRLRLKSVIYRVRVTLSTHLYHNQDRSEFVVCSICFDVRTLKVSKVECYVQILRNHMVIDVCWCRGLSDTVSPGQPLRRTVTLRFDKQEINSSQHYLHKPMLGAANPP
jgi:hypothetical protein